VGRLAGTELDWSEPWLAGIRTKYVRHDPPVVGKAVGCPAVLSADPLPESDVWIAFSRAHKLVEDGQQLLEPPVQIVRCQGLGLCTNLELNEQTRLVLGCEKEISIEPKCS
jgi:hypothetical protein